MFRLWCHRDRPCNKTKRCIKWTKVNWKCEKWCDSHVFLELLIRISWIYRLTSSALWAIKNPCVFACILAPRGLMEILQSAPSSVALISIASKSSFNFVKHNLNDCNGYLVYRVCVREGERCENRIALDLRALGKTPCVKNVMQTTMLLRFLLFKKNRHFGAHNLSFFLNPTPFDTRRIVQKKEEKEV